MTQKCSMVEKTRTNTNFPIITKGDRFTRVNESVIFQIKGGLWRYKREGVKMDFYSRLGAVSYAIAFYTNQNPESFRRLDDKLAKHKNDCMFHKYHLKEAYKKHDEDAIGLYETLLEQSLHRADTVLNELKELSKAIQLV